MSNPKDGGPAHPIPQSDLVESHEAHLGKSLRDSFAESALIGLLSKYRYEPHCNQDAADSAYRYADAMLKARGEEK